MSQPKYRDQKSCQCTHCQYGSKKQQKITSHQKARKVQKKSLGQYMKNTKDDYAVSFLGTGYWD